MYKLLVVVMMFAVVSVTSVSGEEIVAQTGVRASWTAGGEKFCLFKSVLGPSDGSPGPSLVEVREGRVYISQCHTTAGEKTELFSWGDYSQEDPDEKILFFSCEDLQVVAVIEDKRSNELSFVYVDLVEFSTGDAGVQRSTESLESITQGTACLRSQSQPSFSSGQAREAKKVGYYDVMGRMNSRKNAPMGVLVGPDKVLSKKLRRQP